MLPRPGTAVPLETTATKFAREVGSLARRGSRAISVQATATPGEWASARSRRLPMLLVGVTESLSAVE